MDIEKLKASDEIAMGVAIHKLKTAIDRYLDNKPVITAEDLEFLKTLFYDIDDFCQALYHEGR